MGGPLKLLSNCEAERATIQVGEFLSIITEFGSHCQKLPSCWHISFGTETELFSFGFDSLMQVQVSKGSDCQLLSKNLRVKVSYVFSFCWMKTRYKLSNFAMPTTILYNYSISPVRWKTWSIADDGFVHITHLSSSSPNCSGEFSVFFWSQFLHFF